MTKEVIIMANYIDKNGYERGKPEHSDLIHRQIAHKQIYLKNRKKYPLKFSGVCCASYRWK